jgi:sugar-specific transcriptional regulator TrmB
VTHRDVLKELGISDTGIDLYLEMLRNGSGTASSLSKRAGVGRRLAYDRMDSLVNMGIASYEDRDDKRVYHPVKPERLQDLVDERRREVEELDRKLSEALPDLSKLKEREEEDREVRIMEGKEGIKSVFNDEVRVGETVYLIGSPAKSEEILEYFLPSFTRRRKEKNVHIKGVFEDGLRGQVGEHGQLDARFLPPEHTSQVSISIYGDNVSIIFWIETPLVVMIRDSDAAESFMGYFEMAWESAME